MAQVQGAHASRMPEVTGTASFTEQKQSYNYLIPKAGAAPGLERLRRCHRESGLGAGFLGQEPRGIGCRRIRAARGQVEIAQTRLILSTSVASAYAGLVHLYTLRDNAADTLAIANQDRGAIPPAARFRSRELGERASGRGAAGGSAGRAARDR